MGKMVKLKLKGFLGNNNLIYLFISIFLIMGIIFGVIGTKALPQQQLSNLSEYLDESLDAVSKSYDYNNIIKHAIWRNLKSIFKIWFLGLTVIGIPLILAIIFTKGFVLGFTVGFFLENKAWQGLGIIFLTIFPQNVIQIPALVIAGVSATVFSTNLLQRKNDSKTIISDFLKYSLFMIFIALAMIVAALIEGYLTPLAAKAFNLW